MTEPVAGTRPSVARTAWRAVRERVGVVATGAMDLVYPLGCGICGTYLEFHRDPAICDSCYQALPGVGSDVCLRCGAPQGEHVGRIASCAKCKGATPGLKRVIAAGDYVGVLEETIKAFKYAREQWHGPALAALLADQLRGESLLEEVDFVCSVPLHWRRAFERGFDQAALLAHGIARRLRKRHVHGVLKRRRATQPQASLPEYRRGSNVEGAFVVPAIEPWNPLSWRRRGRLDGATVLLVDDVMTSGHTLSEAALALKRGGARTVYGAVLARA